MLKGRPIIFGEVLFDCFHDEATLGGAPFNVAWHLQGFGLNPLFISRIGEDDLGHDVLRRMKSWSMETAGLQRDPEHPTGTVEVTLQNGQPSYEIVSHRAYDFIDAKSASAAVSATEAALLYHGTLAVRQEESGAALAEIRGKGDLPVFVDINLRDPWWQPDKVRNLVRGTHWVKLNAEELRLLGDDRGSDLMELSRTVQKNLDLAVLIVTRGEQGSFVLSEGHRHQVQAPRLVSLVDAVGAGDAFSAVCIAGLLRGWPWPTTLERAAHFAAQVTGYRGAIREDRTLYESALDDWKDG